MFTYESLDRLGLRENRGVVPHMRINWYMVGTAVFGLLCWVPIGYGMHALYVAVVR